MKKIIAFVCLGLLTACMTLPSPKMFVQDGRETDAVQLRANSLRVVSNVHYSDAYPNVEYKMPINPEQALITWAYNHFRANDMNTPVTATLTINQASMTGTNVPTPSIFTYDNIEYRLDYNVTLTFENRGEVINEYTAVGYEMETMPARKAIDFAPKTWEKMLNRMIDKLSVKLNEGVPANLRINQR